MNTGFHGTWEGHKDADIVAFLNSTDLWMWDGFFAMLIARLKSFPKVKSIAGEDLMKKFLALVNEKRLQRLLLRRNG